MEVMPQMIYLPTSSPNSAFLPVPPIGSSQPAGEPGDAVY